VPQRKKIQVVVGKGEKGELKQGYEAPGGVKSVHGGERGGVRGKAHHSKQHRRWRGRFPMGGGFEPKESERGNRSKSGGIGKNF